MCFANHPLQVLQPIFNIPDAASTAPVPLGGKVDDVSGVGQCSGFEHEHPARPNLAAPTSIGIGAEILRKRFLELQGDPSPHDTDAVDRVNQCLGILAKNISCGEADHLMVLVVCPRSQ